MRIVGAMPDYAFDINKFTCGNTHGDYTISQLIWLDERVNGVIDLTCACKHPYIWEIVRSYVYMAPEAGQGEIDADALLRYIADYMEYAPLNAYDIENAGKLFYYFLAVCNFYGQYYGSISENRHIYLKQAELSSRLLAWFEKHIDELNEKLRGLSAQIADQKKLSVFYDSQRRLVQYPRKRAFRITALTKIADCFDKGRKYTKKDVNEIIRQNISFSDIELIRRELIDYRMLGRLRDGSEYWRE